VRRRARRHALARALAVPLALALAAALAVPTAAAGPARASGDGAIAVLPLTSSEGRLQIYGVPVARVLATQLASATGATVQPVSSAGALPKRIAWVIDGRIVARGEGAIALEARLRDPGRGSATGQVATRAGRLTEIDQLARELAGALVPLLARGEAERAARQAEARRMAKVAREAPAPPSSGAAAAASGGAAARASAERPVMVITRDREPIVTDALADLARRLGFRPVIGEMTGIAPPAKVVSELRRHGARLALLLEVRGVDYAWRGVLTARGRVRIVLVSEAGTPLWGDWLETDTLVGSRGDRHAALLGFVARQVTDMALPPLKRALARR